MPTEKLYYEDCHRQTFIAAVTGCERTDGGWCITLSATAFYPEGGGQACDLGTLDDAKVLDVREKNGEVMHLCDKPLALGKTVSGCIDWARRLDLMQQHSGEHIVSGLLHAAFGYHNIGFHVGKDVVEVDFDGPISPEALADIERRANEAVWADLPVKCWYPTEAELPGVSYRAKRSLPWPVRIVQVPGYDSCACCGIHVGHTGEIGLIKILSCVKFHAGVRLEMVCGGRAYRYMTAIFNQNRQVSQAFSAKPLETGDAARKQAEMLVAEKQRGNELQKQVFGYIAERYVNQTKVLHFADGLTGTQLRELADAIAEKTGGRAAVFSGTDGSGYSYCLATRGGDLRELGKAMTAALNGRGGGKPEFQQGSITATRAQIENFFAEA